MSVNPVCAGRGGAELPGAAPQGMRLPELLQPLGSTLGHRGMVGVSSADPEAISVSWTSLLNLAVQRKKKKAAVLLFCLSSSEWM